MTISPATDADVADAKRHVWKSYEVLEYLRTADKCRVAIKGDSYSKKCAAQSLRGAANKLGIKLAIYKMTYGLLVVKK